ncbi:PKD domain-containing protein [Methanospirillum hungatei]|uniref:PKD domain-containing protein n=1 Tax=Methanospirillum hungatei TaxID=2203 RepID=UPI0026EB7EFD|nr:PKD domain-containing protein [Methanospirillum hungatei]MCA1917524.1 PKD domain-containing protein [Methanospirillum hungatei]
MPGQWNVVVTNPGGSPATLNNSFTITGNVPPPVVAKFYGNPNVEVFPYTVHFYDVSTGYPASWRWTFSDGTSSTEQNPTHTSDTVGTYEVYCQRCGAISANAEDG